MATFGYHAVYDESYDDALGYAAEVGFDYVQFDLNVPRFFLNDLSPSEIRRIRSLASKLGLGVSFHAPGDNISLFTDYHRIRDAIISHLTDILAVAGGIGARHLTVHPGAYPSFRISGEDGNRYESTYGDYYRGILRENLALLARKSPPVLLCVENVGMGEITRAALENLFEAGLPTYLTWDWAKSWGSPAVEAFFRRHVDRIREVHIHDAIPGTQSHLPIGEGGLDFAGILDIIELPAVATTIEVRPREEATRSREYLLQMLRDR